MYYGVLCVFAQNGPILRLFTINVQLTRSADETSFVVA